jgi:F420-0:gamma-glutamyl ligase-like protein
MTKYKVLSVATGYWKPNDNYTDEIIFILKDKIQNDDFVVVSEKAISTASGNVEDENMVMPSANAKFIAGFWMRIVWGYCLGVLCHFGPRLLKRLREYPFESGSRHKQVALEQAGLFQALMFGSEGAIDGSNLAYSYVSLPLKNADKVAKKIRKEIFLRLKMSVCVVIADTDKTYKFRNFYFTPRPKPFKGIQSWGGVTTYILGRALRFKKSSTPLAVAGCKLQAAEALKITNIADKARGSGTGATVWDMAARFHVDITGVSWEMLGALTHRPIVILRKKTI